MSNQELVQVGRKQMDQTDQTIERSKKVCEIPSSPPLHQLSSVLVWNMGFWMLRMVCMGLSSSSAVIA
jgi:hypothetical protein